MSKFLFPLMLFSLLFMSYLSKLSYDNSEKIYFQAHQVNLYQADDINKAKQILDSVLDAISFHIFGGKEQIKLDNLKEKNNYYLQNNMKYWITFIITFFIISITLLQQEKELFYLFLSIVTFLTLGVSMITPILFFSSQVENTHYIGHINTYSDEVNTISKIIQKNLLNQKYFFVSIIFFFMILSFIKSISLLVMTFSKKISFINQIKKWIILELIFVNLIFFLGLFFIIKEEKRDFSLESGFYFYLFYTFLSLVFLFQKVEKKDLHIKRRRNNSFKNEYY